MTRVKICGLTRAQDVRLCCRLGAWGVGFVLTKSPRQVSAEQAGMLRRAVTEWASASRPAIARPLTVGVFTLESAEHIAAVVAAAGLDAVQLSAGSDGSTVAEVRSACAAGDRRGIGDRVAAALGDGRRGIGVVGGRPPLADKGSRDGRPLVIAAADAADAAAADLVLFDSRAGDRYGGTGEPLDWRALAARLREADPSTARPADEAAAAGTARPPAIVLAGGLTPANVGEAVTTVRPYAVDVSGGVEHAPGVKDAALLTAFFAAVGRADRDLARVADRDPAPDVPADHPRSVQP